MFLFGIVKVPVLSVTNTSTLRRLSKAAASLIRICFCAALPIPTISAVGVANPIAHGHAMTKTATADMIACGKALFPPINHHKRKVTRAIQATTGTNTKAALSTIRWTGAFEPCASCTILIM